MFPGSSVRNAGTKGRLERQPQSGPRAATMDRQEVGKQSCISCGTSTTRMSPYVGAMPPFSAWNSVTAPCKAPSVLAKRASTLASNACSWSACEQEVTRPLPTNCEYFLKFQSPFFGTVLTNSASACLLAPAKRIANRKFVLLSSTGFICHSGLIEFTPAVGSTKPLTWTPSMFKMSKFLSLATFTTPTSVIISLASELPLCFACGLRERSTEC
mmetsp:Transcript_81369/g.233845  ORF Transcript_81369/g.233845 Transcript_81369/m.233845 type:complete len:214 (-) Transcript_81369:128-769(-)